MELSTILYVNRNILFIRKCLARAHRRIGAMRPKTAANGARRAPRSQPIRALWPIPRFSAALFTGWLAWGSFARTDSMCLLLGFNGSRSQRSLSSKRRRKSGRTLQHVKCRHCFFSRLIWESGRKNQMMRVHLIFPPRFPSLLTSLS